MTIKEKIQKTINIKLETNSIAFLLNLEKRNLPKKIAIELLAIIPKIEPKIKESL